MKITAKTLNGTTNMGRELLSKSALLYISIKSQSSDGGEVEEYTGEGPLWF